MKKLLILIVVVQLIVHSFGQNPLLSIDSTSQWNMSRYVHALENDTMIQEKNYKKIIEYKDFEKSKILDTYYLREDSTGKVHLADGKREVLAFDFGMEAGDSLILNLLCFQSDKYNLLFKIDSIRTIVLNGKEYPAQFVSAYSYYNYEVSEYFISDIFVKGIGSLRFGIVYPPLFVVGGSTPFLLCYLAKNEVVYQSPDCSDCFTFVSAPLNEVSPQLINLFPSKNGLLKLQPINGNIGEFSLYLLDGKQIVKQKVNGIETELFSPTNGVLLYRYITKKGEIQTGKVVIK